MASDKSSCPFPDTQTSGLTYGGAISHIAVGSVTQFSACRARGAGVAGRPAAAGSGDPVATRPFDVFRQQRASAVRAVADEIPRRGTVRDRVVQGAVPRPPADVEHVSPWSRRRHRRGARARVRHCPLLCGTKCLCVGNAEGHALPGADVRGRPANTRSPCPLASRPSLRSPSHCRERSHVRRVRRVARRRREGRPAASRPPPRHAPDSLEAAMEGCVHPSTRHTNNPAYTA